MLIITIEFGSKKCFFSFLGKARKVLRNDMKLFPMCGFESDSSKIE